MKRSKRFREMAEKLDLDKIYSIEEAVDLLKQCPPVKFDQTVELSLKTGIDAKKSDQQVRGTISLPNGTGKSLKVLVFTQGEKVNDAKAAGAEFAGADELIEKVKGGWTGFDAVVASPDMMREVGKLGKVLGPRGLMPTPKGGTVTPDVAKAVQELKAGKIEFKSDKHGVINSIVGKISFEKEKLVENIKALLASISRSRPATSKGSFIVSLTLSSTMGPGFKIDTQTLGFES